MRREVEVLLGERTYRIHICSGELSEIGAFVSGVHSASQCAVVTDENVAPLYAQPVIDSLGANHFGAEVIVLPAGEEHKNLQSVRSVYAKLVDFKLDRESLVVALGGGVVGDVAGFVAATYMRGISYVQAPTTLLAHVDSSVGGKTGVNLPQGKNLVGAFYQPRGVFIDVSTLDTLPPEEFKSGMVEVVKHGIIRDETFFNWLEENMPALLSREQDALIHAVRRSCEIKAEVVSLDEKEAGLRAILNYGHTVGHALECLTDYHELRHGEAVSMGMEVAAEVACRMGILPREEAARQRALLKNVGTPLRLPPISVDEVREVMALDKKAAGGRSRFILARRMGTVQTCDDVPPEVVRESLLSLGAID